MIQSLARFLRGKPSFALAALAWLVPVARATWQDEIGYTRLVQELGAALPKGAGVSATLVEATLTTEGGEYLPTTDPAPASGNLAGKTFEFKSGTSPQSFHAARVAAFFFGANTNPLAGDASVAPLAGTAPAAGVDCYQADGWLGGDFLRLGRTQLPRLDDSSVGNHSWIASVGPDFPASDANESLQRLDWSVASSDHVAVVGLNNGAATGVPALLGSAYNVISVGRTDGQHSTGTSSADVDGPGRAKPELVAPMTATSWSTGVVSSCAAVLAEAGGALSPEGRKSEVVRAVLLAGARKDPFPGWANTNTRPLDPHFGAGEVNIWRSYQTLVAGEVADGAPSPVSRSGWHFAASIGAGQTRTYSMQVPEGCLAREVSAALVWNRTVTTSPPSFWFNATPDLANLDLRLQAVPEESLAVDLARSESGASGSVAHPLEHIHLKEVPSGTYTLQVENSATSPSTPYGLAWYLALEPATTPEVVSEWTSDSQSLTLGFSKLGIGLTYALQVSEDLLAWETQLSLTPSTTTAVLTVASPSTRAFYRLSWVPPAATAAAAVNE